MIIFILWKNYDVNKTEKAPQVVITQGAYILKVEQF